MKKHDLSELTPLIDTFSKFYLEKMIDEKEVLNDKGFLKGVDAGVRTSLIFLKSFILDDDGNIDQKKLEDILSNIKKHKTN